MDKFNLMEIYKAAKEYIVTLSKDGETLEFNSFREAADFIKKQTQIETKETSIIDSLTRTSRGERKTSYGYEVTFHKNPIIF